jgi:hypothetical protein
MRDGMQLGQLLNDKSYAKHYFDTLDREFELYPLVQFIITEPIPYWRNDYMTRIRNLTKHAKQVEGREKKRFFLLRLNWKFRNESSSGNFLVFIIGL